jgi:acetyl-CoA carboxylase carboxyl transferase subunit beta
VAWFRKDKKKLPAPAQRREPTSDVWVKCEGCGEIIYKKELARNLWVCPKCRYHFRIASQEYVELLADPGTFREADADLLPVDPLGFVDRKPYVDRLAEYRQRTGRNEAVLCGDAEVGRVPASLAVMDFGFIGGSMGSVVGEKVARTVERGLSGDRAVIVVSASGGARMMEGILSLMQMAKTAALLAALNEKRIPFVSILTDPTTGGVTASYASLGDLILAEPGARIGFAGPRVIKQTIGQDLPPGFQTAEFLLEHGLVDAVVDRSELRATTVRALRQLRGLPLLSDE